MGSALFLSLYLFYFFQALKLFISGGGGGGGGGLFINQLFRFIAVKFLGVEWNRFSVSADDFWGLICCIVAKLLVGMVGEEDDPTGSEGQFQIPGGRKSYWRSASWSSSRSMQQSPALFDNVKECADPLGTEKNNGGQFRRFPVPLTPRSQQNCKARACLPPLQPLSIARRSLDEWPKAGSDDLGEWPQPPTPSGKGESLKPREGLKLDVSLCQKIPDPSGSLASRDRIAFFDKECSKVADHIYLGGDAVARNRDILRHNGITHVLNCVGFVCPEYFKADLVYKTLWLQDSPSEDITSILYDVFDYFEDVREQGGRVFVHCCQGVSRSTSLVIAYLMWREGQSFDDAFQFVKTARRIANPNMGFACQLLQCQKRVHAIPLSPSSVLRMYRMAPHSPYDPLHLVPKMLNDPSPAALDSRGAFIIHVPSAIYVWIGKRCEPIMERDTKGAAYQVVRYERVQGPIITIEEGEEPLEFCDAFCNLAPSIEKSINGARVRKDQVESVVKIIPGERKVDLYDVDFELFQKAIAGGFVPPFSSSDAGEETHLPARESNWSVLRRKFASGKMKEFVSAPKVSLCRVYSDSMLIVDSDSRVHKIPTLPVDSSTLSSPSYLSPSSLSSDSSTSCKFSSESPSQSPSTSSCSLTPSPASSTSSDSLYLSSNNSTHPICNSPGVPGVGQASKSCSQTVLSPSKRFALSLAERRGSLSPSLKLPSLKGDVSLSSRRLKNASASSLASQQSGFEKNSNTCSLDNTCNTEEVRQFKGGIENEEGDATKGSQLQMCRGGSTIDGLSCNQSALVKTCEEPPINCPLQNGSEFSMPTGLMDKGSKICSPVQPLVFRWPNLEKIAAFAGGGLDSESAFLFLAPSTGGSKDMDRIPYLWIGKFFKHDNSHIQLNNNGDVTEIEEVDWNQVGCDFHNLMDLPKDITIKLFPKLDCSLEFRSSDLVTFLWRWLKRKRSQQNSLNCCILCSTTKLLKYYAITQTHNTAIVLPTQVVYDNFVRHFLRASLDMINKAIDEVVCGSFQLDVQ
ncbi:Dual specificity phosphatase [Macleaya cordata]|uniref:Dual specificity phosphatase n=1 Tax=Macleaya cordata TaxID=56857 RepID=A0A200R6G8_MACCD|nr:Dual specificity phosphatase [Macleaya cordata]